MIEENARRKCQKATGRIESRKLNLDITSNLARKFYYADVGSTIHSLAVSLRNPPLKGAVIQQDWETVSRNLEKGATTRKNPGFKTLWLRKEEPH